MISTNNLSRLVIFILVFNVFFAHNVKSQNRRYAKNTIKRLCSKEFLGRGYSHGGDIKAADFIIKKLKKYKSKPFNADSYKQEFGIKVNTFPSEMSVKINDKLLVPQIDYLVSARSNSTHGKYPVLTLNAKVLNNPNKLKAFDFNHLTDYFLFIDSTNVNNAKFHKSYKEIIGLNLFKAKGIITSEAKGLTHVPSQVATDFTVVKIKKQAIPERIDSIELGVDNEYFDNYLTNNIAAYFNGKSDSFIVFTCHYDHLGEMGKGIYFPGANDNASGTAMVLDLVRHFSKNKDKLKYSIAFLFFSGEELGLLGSFYYVDNPLFPLQSIKYLINLDMVGSGDKGITVVNGTEFKQEFNKLVELNEQNKYLPKVNIRGPAANSDHYPFYKSGVKSFFIYTLGQYKEYHSIHDNAKNLPLSRYNGLFKLLLDFVEAS